MAAAVQRSLMLTSNSLSAVPVVVAAGARSGIPHSTWCGAEVERHRPVFLEYSGAWHRYHAPVMRTICVGEPRDDRLGRLCQLAEATIAAVEETLRAGIAAADIAEAAERAIGPLEPWIVFHHNFGYPVGLGHPPTWMDCAQWSLVATNHEPVLEGTVLHVPAVFRAPAVGGVGHSQTYLVTATGCERLTATDPTISVVT
jgi:Xaa-Pro dipeptidase